MLNQLFVSIQLLNNYTIFQHLINNECGVGYVWQTLWLESVYLMVLPQKIFNNKQLLFSDYCQTNFKQYLFEGEWIFKKQAIYCATLENLALGKTNLSKSIAKSASRFILRPTIIEGTPAQLKEEYSGFRGTKKANYVSTFLQRKKLAAAFQINWSQIQNPLLELKIRKKWIEKSKECKFFQNKGHISMSPTGSLPALELDSKKFQGSSRCIPSFPKPRKLTACNICPIVTGLLKHDMSQVSRRYNPLLYMLSAVSQKIEMSRTQRYGSIGAQAPTSVPAGKAIFASDRPPEGSF